MPLRGWDRQPRRPGICNGLFYGVFWVWGLLNPTGAAGIIVVLLWKAWTHGGGNLIGEGISFFMRAILAEERLEIPNQYGFGKK